MDNEQKIPTNLGPMGINEIFDHLNYVSYATNRDLGMSHESLAPYFVKAEDFQRKYEAEKKPGTKPQ